MSHEDTKPTPVSEQNIERLLGRSYQPDRPDPEFLARLTEKLVRTTAEPVLIAQPVSGRRTITGWAVAAAAVLVCVALSLHLHFREQAPKIRPQGEVVWIDGRAYVLLKDSHGRPLLKPASKQQVAAVGTHVKWPAGGPGLVPRERPAPPAARRLRIGDLIVTAAGQRRRVLLPDGSVLFVNQRTRARLTAERTLEVTQGEVFIEVAPRYQSRITFRVRTPKRQLSALGTRFAVSVDRHQTEVLVTQGKVQVDGVLVHAGQQLLAAGPPVSAPRASHRLEWTRELRIAAVSPLVPRSAHTGGALICVDPWGQKNRLELRKYHIDVQIEDGFARTTIDQTYFNHQNWRQEGTFYFPLPPDASLSRLAMYVDGQLMEGGMAERTHARRVYEQIVSTQKDPALLEWVDGSTFKMRVYPLEAREEKRILISYTQRLSSLYGRTRYRFPGGHNLGLIKHWSVKVRLTGGARASWQCPSHTLQARKQGGDLLLNASQQGVIPKADLVLNLFERGAPKALRLDATVHEGSRYLMLRYRPELRVTHKTTRRDWVILFESSGKRDPLLARVQLDVIQTLLENAERQDTFSLLTVGTRLHALAAEPLPVTAENVARAVAFLQKSHLVGALDLARAFRTVGPMLEAADNPVLLHVGGGLATFGERRVDRLVELLPPRARYVGVAVGKRWSRQLMKQLAAQSGGLVAQINPDEPVVWRAFELLSTLNTSRLLDIEVRDPDSKTRYLRGDDAIAQGETMLAIGRMPEGSSLPRRLQVRGWLDGKRFEQMIAVREVRPGAGHLPRTWAKLELDRLLAADSAKHKKAIIELSKRMYVMSPYTSLLVLENEAMYKRFKVDRGRKDHWALYSSPERVPVVFESDPSNPIAQRTWGRPNLTGGKPRKDQPAQARKLTNEQLLATIVRRRRPELLRSGEDHGLLLGFLNKAAGHRFQIEVPLGARTGPLGGGSSVGLEVFPMGGHSFDGDFLAGYNYPLGAHPTTKSKSAVDGFRPKMPRRYFFNLGFMNRKRGSKFARSTISSNSIRRLLLGHPLARHMDSGGWLPARTQRGMDRWASSPGNGTFRIWNARDLTGRLGGDIPGPMLGRPASVPFSGFFLKARDGYYSTILPPLAHRQAPGQFLLYQKPRFANDWGYFGDLTHHAPGLNTSPADVRALLEAEGRKSARLARGKIDRAAARLIARARDVGWQSLRSGSGRIVFSGAGRFVWQRTLKNGLQERIVSDGVSLWQLYPELGLGARRKLSRHHLALLRAAVPWHLATAKTLARGADVTLLAARTVAVTPRGGKHRLELRFDKAGQLIERRLVRLSDGKLLDRQDLVAARKRLAPRAAQRPDFSIGRQLVVLPMPIRTRSFTLKAHGINDENYSKWTERQALAVITSGLVRYHGELVVIIRNRFLARGDRRIGWSVLLQTNGRHGIEKLPQRSALGDYLRQQRQLMKRGHKQADVSPSNRSKRGFIARISRLRQLAVQQANQQTADALSKLLEITGDVPKLRYPAAYEQARQLYRDRRYPEARRRFAEAYRAELARGLLPRIDVDFRKLLARSAAGRKIWRALMQEAAAKHGRVASVLLAWQSHLVGTRELADELLAGALAGVTDKQRLRVTLVAVEYLWHTMRRARAARLLNRLLDRPEYGGHSKLWRMAAELASQRRKLAQTLYCQERAIELEYQQLPDVVNLEWVRQEFSTLLARYGKLADAIATLDRQPPTDVIARVVRAADRWRKLDSDITAACEAAAGVLQTLGAKELAWDYLTTSLAARTGVFDPVASLELRLRQRGQLELADRLKRQGR